MRPYRRPRWGLLGATAIVALGVTTLSPGAEAGSARAPGDTHMSVVRDIWPGHVGSVPSDLAVTANGNLFYAATHEAYGRELWMTTPAGVTKMVRNLVADPDGLAIGSFPSRMTAAGNKVFFLANDWAGDEELYVSDGTAAGTRFVKELHPFADAEVTEMIGVGDILYFVIVNDVGRTELWRSDGTPPGTRILKNYQQVQDFDPRNLTEMGGDLYFTAFRDTQVGSGGVYLWRSDGTSAGTVPVKRTNLIPEHLTAVGNNLYFSGLVAGNPSDEELYVSDGTAAGTRVVRNLVTAAGSGSSPKELTAVGNLLYFTAQVAGDRELYKSDGTPAGTRRVRDINPGGSSSPTDLTDVNGTVYFAAFKDSSIQLWTSNGTVAGTKQLPSANPFGTTSPQELTAVGDLLFYRAFVAADENQLWVTDGTAAGTRAVGPISPHNDVSPGDLTERNGELYLRDGVQTPGDVYGPELYRVTVEQ